MCKCSNHNNCQCNPLFKSEGLMVQFPALIKAFLSKGRRIIEFEASCASVDAEGDCIEQKALLNSADYFIKNGFIDIDHYCELGRNPAYAWLGIKDPDSWIVGKPLEVMDLGNYRTGIKAEINQSPKGEFNPLLHKSDWLWNKLKTESGMFFASVFGYPGADTEEGGCTMGTDGYVCATRYLVKSFRWHSTALTRNPINKSLKHPVQIMSMKSFALNYAVKMGNVNLNMLKPLGAMDIVYREDLRKSYFSHIMIDCPETDHGYDVTVKSICNHYMNCEGIAFNLADVYALATSELIRRIK